MCTFSKCQVNIQIKDLTLWCSLSQRSIVTVGYLINYNTSMYMYI